MRSITLDPRDAAALIAALTERGATVVLRPRGGSMSPAILGGDRVWIEAVRPGTLARGQIVLTRTDRPRLHRIVGIGPAGCHLVTAGDACQRPDPGAPVGAVVGRVARIRRSRPARLRRLVGRFFRRASACLPGDTCE